MRYSPALQEQIAEVTDLYPEVLSADTLETHWPDLAEVEVIFGTWGMPALTQRQLEMVPNLQALFYAVGSVNYFARPLLELGITVVSSWRANGVPVAEFTVGKIILANKGAFATFGSISPRLSIPQPFGGGAVLVKLLRY